MSSINNSVAAQSSTYLESLISYVLEVKPYRTKINNRTGAISESYIFSDNVNISLSEKTNSLTYLGADLVDRSTIIKLTDEERTTIGLIEDRRPHVDDWLHSIVSDGQRTIWPMPNFSNPKFASSARLEKFVSGERLIIHNSGNGFTTGSVLRLDDYQGIVGLTRGVFDPKRWDGPGITEVKKNNIHQQDTIDYFLSHGVFSIDITSDNKWIEHDLNLAIPTIEQLTGEAQSLTGSEVGLNLDGLNSRLASNAAFAPHDSELIYNSTTSVNINPLVHTVGGTVTNIMGGAYQEWILTCIAVNGDTLDFELTGWANGVVVTPPVYFTMDFPTNTPQHFPTADFLIANPGYNIISFDYQTVSVYGDPFYDTKSYDTFPYDEGNINYLITTPTVGDIWTLTPAHKITVAPNAQIETWSLIKTNPTVFNGPIYFNSLPLYAGGPAVEIHTRSLELTAASTWHITFNGDGTYTLGSTLSGYPKTVNLTHGCSYKDANIAFTIIPTVDGWQAGDSFNFTINSKKSHYKVFGSISGWMQDATIDEWYWNGVIGFKIPPLEYFAEVFNSTIASSADGDISSWVVSINNNQTINSIKFVDGGFYIAGKDSIVGASLDGTLWTNDIATVFQPSPLSNKFLMAVGSNGNITASDNGTYWSRENSGVTANLAASTTIPNFLASTGSSVNDLNCIIAVGDSGTIITSAVGIGWALQLSGVTTDLKDIAWSDDAIIVIGTGGTILRSLDRLVWTLIPSGTISNLNSIIYVPNDSNNGYSSIPGIFTIVGDNGTILRSEDGGLTWLNLNAFSDGIFNSVAYGNNKYVAVGISAYIAESLDGIIWTRYQSKIFNSIAFGNGVFVAVGGGATSSPQFIAIDRNTGLDSMSASPSVMAEPSSYAITFTTASSNVTAFTFTIISQTYQVSGDDDTHNPLMFNDKAIDNQQIEVLINGIITTEYVLNPNEIVFNTLLTAGTIITVNFVQGNGSSIYTYRGSATVYNNIYGFRDNLEADTNWSDEFTSFRLITLPGIEYSIGDRINVYMAPKYIFDNANENITVPYLYDSEVFPLVHSHGAVIFPEITDGDNITIDKAFYDIVKLYIENSSSNHIELGGSNGWIPLFFKSFDILPAVSPIANAEFSDLATYTEAYSAATGQLVFSITSPRFLKTNRASQSTLSFNVDFFKKYIPFNTKYTIMVKPDESYGQHIRVKVSENLKIYARIKMVFNDQALIKVVDIIDWWHGAGTAVYFGEGPATGYWRYELVNPEEEDRNLWVYELIFITPADAPNDQAWTYPFSISITEGGAALVDPYDIPDYDSSLYDGTGIFPMLTVFENVVANRTIPADESSDSVPEQYSTNFIEGLSILQTPLVGGNVSLTSIFDFNSTQPTGSSIPDTAPGLLISQITDEYQVVMLNKPNSISGTWIVAPESDHLLLQSGTIVYNTLIGGTVIDLNTFTFTLPIGLTAPFRLWIV